MYPIKFKPILKPMIWGGHRLLDIKKGQYGKIDTSALYGESWDVSGLEGNISKVANGILKGNNLQEIIEVYMGDLVGEKNFERYGLDFPLLVKNLDCNDTLSVQVHPDDELAAERHNSFGKTEMWYIASAEPGAVIYIGFKNPELTREEYIEAVAEGRIAELLRAVPVKAGDVFFIPAGTVHALAAGLNVIEIQQTSDITYRIFDWNRVDANGNARELHTAQAIDAIDFSSTADSCYRPYTLTPNIETDIVACEYFTTKGIRVEGRAEIDYASRDTFVIYACIDGSVEVSMDGVKESFKAGEVLLLPASACDVTLTGTATILESYIE